MPRWFLYSLRTFIALFVALTTWFSIQDWSAMPWGFRILACILIPSYLLLAFHPKLLSAWSSSPFFHADSLGMYFRSGVSSNTIRGRGSPDRWLFVPWENISNIKFAWVNTSDGASGGAAFDVIALPEEVAEFFYDDLVERNPPLRGRVSVAFYVNTPPSPRKVVESLLDLQKQHFHSFRRAASPTSAAL
jgi:hypothetical protein